MIRHFSFAAENPRLVAEAMAEMLGGRSIPSQGRPERYMALSNDAHGTWLEIDPMSTELVPSAEGLLEYRNNLTPSRYTATHAALSVSIDEATILALAAWGVIRRALKATFADDAESHRRKKGGLS
jgi:hypothetical protein